MRGAAAGHSRLLRADFRGAAAHPSEGVNMKSNLPPPNHYIAGAWAKDASRRGDVGLSLHSFRTLLKDLGTLTYNITHTALNPEAKITLTARATPLQDKAFKPLGLDPARTL